MRTSPTTGLFGTALVLSASMCASVCAQSDTPAPTRMAGQVDQVTGAPSMGPKSMPLPSAGWGDADRTESACKRGAAVLEAAQKAYQAAKNLTDHTELTIAMPDGEQNEVIDMSFGTGDEMLIKMGSLQIVSTGGTVYFVPDQPADKYLSKKIEGNANATLIAMLPGFSLPAPALAMRQPAAGSKITDAFAMGAKGGVAIKGFREYDGKQEILVGGTAAEGVVSFDSKTNFITGFNMQMTPDGLPATVRIGFIVKCAPSAEALKTPISFDAGKRVSVAKLEDLFTPPADEPAPGITVKDGQAAPLGVLTMLDGKTLDLASLKGKVVVIDFWATWCGPCRKGLPLLQTFADQMKGNDKVAIYAVNVWEQQKGDELTKKVTDFWTKQAFTMNVAMDPEAKLIMQYGFQGIPACIIIGADGMLVSSHMGYDPEMVSKLTTDVNKALGVKDAGAAAPDSKAADSKGSGTKAPGLTK
ncbi:MAG: TlpA disulfide reductase family protein [Planctomycetota bacterium]|nr:TlpA disulfide reductase family protein [Planctomycetota bacterium]